MPTKCSGQCLDKLYAVLEDDLWTRIKRNQDWGKE